MSPGLLHVLLHRADGDGRMTRMLGRAHPPAIARDVVRWLTTTVDACYRYRVMGLAAETAFFALLSLPPLFFGLAGATGFIARSLSGTTVASFRDQLLSVASRTLTPETITSVLAPTLDDVLGRGRADVVSVGFLLALWSGSRAIAVLVDTCTIMYGARGHRGIVRSRALSVVLYLIMLTTAAVLAPLVLAGPALVQAVLPSPLAWAGALYWPVVVLASLAMLTSLFDVAVPLQHRWIAHLPGVILTATTWALGSWLMRELLVQTLGGASLYGPLAAPIGLMLWLYVFALAILLGAAANAAVAVVWPQFAGLNRAEEGNVVVNVPPPP